MPDFLGSVFSFPIDVFRVVARPLDDWTIQQPSLPCWRLWWNSEPGARVTWRGRRFALSPDRVILVAPETEFEALLVKPVALHLFIHFTPGALDWRRTDQLISLRIPSAIHEAILALSKKLSDAAHPAMAEPLRAISLITSVLALIDVARWPAPPADPRVRRVMAAIDADPGADWPDSALARIASMSIGGLARLFRTQTGGLSPQSYLQRQRLALARHLLMQDGLSIDSIAERCGYCDRSYFSTVFRKAVGVAPAKYKLHIR